MIINSNKIFIDNFPNFICSSCGTGVLRAVKDSVKYERPSHIQKLPISGEIRINDKGEEHKEIGLDDILETEYDEYITIMFIKCDNEKCNEIYSSCGFSKYINEFESSDGFDVFEETKFYYFPKYIHPTLRLFVIPSTTPKKIVDELYKSFSLFWNDLDATGNSIRKAIERIIQDLIGVTAKHQSLHSRINSLPNTYINVKNKLMALKIIGNEASHNGNLELYDIIFSFEIVEDVLNSLYVGDTKTNIIEDIIKENKPPSRFNR